MIKLLMSKNANLRPSSRAVLKQVEKLNSRMLSKLAPEMTPTSSQDAIPQHVHLPVPSLSYTQRSVSSIILDVSPRQMLVLLTLLEFPIFGSICYPSSCSMQFSMSLFFSLLMTLVSFDTRVAKVLPWGFMFVVHVCVLPYLMTLTSICAVS